MNAKHHIFALMAAAICFAACEPQESATGKMGPAPSNPHLTINDADPYNPVFRVWADNGFTYSWDMGNGQVIAPGRDTATAYYPLPGSYNVSVTIYGEGAQEVTADTLYTVTTADPTMAEKPLWKELTGGGKGATWVYNTDTLTGKPDYCYQTTGDLVNYPNNWMPASSWGQCERITPDIKGAMTFDLNGGVNYTYHHVAGDAGIKGTFVLDAEKRTLTVKNPYILDHAVGCTQATATATGVYQIMKLTEDELVLWQMQKAPTAGPGSGEGWGWSFKRKR